MPSTMSVMRGDGDLAAHRQQFLASSPPCGGCGEPRMSSSSRIFAATSFSLRLDLLALQAGQALQAQFQDAARLLLGQPHRAVRRR